MGENHEVWEGEERESAEGEECERSGAGGGDEAVGDDMTGLQEREGKTEIQKRVEIRGRVSSARRIVVYYIVNPISYIRILPRRTEGQQQ